MPANKILYFVAIVPPESIAKDITLLKEEIAERYETTAALKSPPHITLIPPFSFDPIKEPFLEEVLIESPKIPTGLHFILQGIGSFGQKVIYIKVSQNKVLTEYQKKMESNFYEKTNLKASLNKNNGFTPHLTLALRDLKPEAFFEIMNRYKQNDFYYEFEAKSFHLLKHHGSSGWKIFKEFELTQGS
ncbi:MAG: 2'-5' RNA ligase family protein [Cyclobacteriaceae bacterium]